MEAEKIILSKQYFELTSVELEQIAALVSNETEFNDMKAFLLSTQTVFESQKIIDSPGLEAKIFSHLNASVSANRPWYNSLLLFLFPRDKRVYQYPSFQLSLVSLLMFGAFNLINFDSLNSNTIAFEDVSKANTNSTSGAEETEGLEFTKENIVLEVSENSSDLNIKNKNKIVLIEQLENDNNEVEFTEKDANQKGYVSDAIEESEDSEIIVVRVVPDLRQGFNSKIKENLDSDALGNIDVVPVVFKETDLEDEGIIENTDSINDKDSKFGKNKATLKKEEVTNTLDDYFNGSVEETINEQTQFKEKGMARKVSVNLTPELNQLFFEVK